jgi:hypothetical protein
MRPPTRSTRQRLLRALEKTGFARTRFVPELARDEYRRPAR